MGRTARAEPCGRTTTEPFVIATQSDDRRAPVPPNPLVPRDRAPLQQREDADEQVKASSSDLDDLLWRLEAAYEFHTMQLAQLGAEPGDGALAFDRNALAAASRHALSAIAAALRDMAEGRYGTCTSCGRPIPLERLEAHPEARCCLRCQVTATR
jgi:DnaK suppressor protein